jgi:hypothetical protein
VIDQREREQAALAAREQGVQTPGTRGIQCAVAAQMLHERVVEAAAERHQRFGVIAVGRFDPDIAHGEARRQGGEQWRETVLARQSLELADHRERLARKDHARPSEQPQQRIGCALLGQHELGETRIAFRACEARDAGMRRRGIEFLRGLAFKAGPAVDHHAAGERSARDDLGHGGTSYFFG